MFTFINQDTFRLCKAASDILKADLEDNEHPQPENHFQQPVYVKGFNEKCIHPAPW